MRMRWLLVCFAVLLFSVDARATGLYGWLRDANGPVVDALVEIDPATGAALGAQALPNRLWADLAGRPGDGANVYSVTRIPGPAFENTVTRIDTATAAVTDLYTFTAADFGFGPGFTLELSGISFVPGDPSLAILTAGFFPAPTPGPPELRVFTLNLDTGATSSLVEISGASNFPGDLSHQPGGPLFAKDLSVIGTLDPVTGAFQSLPGSTVNSLAFDPSSGELFATRGNELVVLSPADGSVQESRGFLGLDGSVNAMAFVVPEPGSGALVLVGLVGLAARRRR